MKRATAIALVSLLLVPVLLATDTLISFIRGWRTNSRIDISIISAMGAWIVIVLLLSFKARLARNSSKFLLLFAVTAVSWAAMECVLAICFRDLRWLDRPGNHLWPPHLRSVMRPNPAIIPGASRETRFTVNSDGIRGPELPARDAAYRILCIGGSTTECVYLDDAAAWPALLMRQLNAAQPASQVWVGNAGMSGRTVAAHVRLILGPRRLPDLDCVIVLAGINDLIEFLLGADLIRERSLFNDELRPIWKGSMAMVLLRRAVKRYKAALVIEDEAGQGYEAVRRHRRASPVIDELPDLHPALERYRNHLLRLTATCRARRLRLILLTQPVMWKEGLSPAAADLLWIGRDARDRYFPPRRLREAIDQYNETLKSVARQEQVEIVDLSSMSGGESYFYDDCHFTEAGAQEVADRVAAHFNARPRAR
jgi:lysophospholipase L1-like esterase